MFVGIFGHFKIPRMKIVSFFLSLRASERLGTNQLESSILDYRLE